MSAEASSSAKPSYLCMQCKHRRVFQVEGEEPRHICSAPLPEYVGQCVVTQLRNDITDVKIERCFSAEPAPSFLVVGHYRSDYAPLLWTCNAPDAAEAEWQVAQEVAARILEHDGRSVSPADVLRDVVEVLAVVKDGELCSYRSVGED